MTFTNKIISTAAWVIVALSGALMFASSYDDSPSYDEVENIAAGYYYVTTQTYWINHYQPPLVKDFAGLVVAATNPKSYQERWEWAHYRRSLCDVFFWGQKDSQNMVRLARIPSILFAIFFLCYFFRRIEREFGSTAGFIAVTMMAMSPTFLAHARFVTTDVPGASCFFISLFTFFDYLRKPSTRSLIVLAIVTGLAFLVKFSLVFLLPIYLLLFFLWNVTKPERTESNRSVPSSPLAQTPLAKTNAMKLLTHTCLFALIVVGIVWLGYYLNMIHQNFQFQDWWIHKHFKYYLNDPRVELISLTHDIPIFRPISWYLTGLLGQYFNVRDGHFSFSYLHGALYKGGNLFYFPYLLVLKEPIGFTLLFLVTLLATVSTISTTSLEFIQSIFKPTNTTIQAIPIESDSVSAKNRTGVGRFKHYIHSNFVVIGSVIFAGLYLLIAMRSNLNIGVRHILPVVPFMYMLTAVGLVRMFSLPGAKEKPVWSNKNTKWILSAILFYGCASSLLAFPGYLSYYNELAGGKVHGLNVAIDSNFDWGTDLYRLKKYADENKIERIHVLYFGAGSPEYYLGKRARLWNQEEILPKDEYFAVSAHFVAQAAALSRLAQHESLKDATSSIKYRGLTLKDKRTMDWFCSLKPIATAGDSILIYKTP